MPDACRGISQRFLVAPSLPGGSLPLVADDRSPCLRHPAFSRRPPGTFTRTYQLKTTSRKTLEIPWLSETQPAFPAPTFSLPFASV